MQLWVGRKEALADKHVRVRSLPGVSYAVNPETSTLELSQQALALDPVSGLLNLVLQPGIYQQDDSAGEAFATTSFLARQHTLVAHRSMIIRLTCFASTQ